VWLNQSNNSSDLLHLLEGNWWPTAIGLVCLVVLIWVVVRLVTRVNEDADPAAIDREMLSAINELHREGDLTPDEYRSIKGQLVRRLQTPDSSSNSPSGAMAVSIAGIQQAAMLSESEEVATSEQSAPTDKTTKPENLPSSATDNEASDQTGQPA
jgi:hypothetical protein